MVWGDLVEFGYRETGLRFSHHTTSPRHVKNTRTRRRNPMQLVDLDSDLPVAVGLPAASLPSPSLVLFCII